MKKCRLLSCVLCIALVCMLLPVSALAAGDLTVAKDTTLSVMRNIYNNVTVKEGVTLTMHNWRPDPQGLEIGASLTVEPGGVVTGGSIIFSRTATCTGLDLYYVVAGEEKLLTVTLAEVVASDPNADYQPVFWYDTATGHYVLKANFTNDPFELPEPGGEGNKGEADAETIAKAEGLKALGLFKGVGTNADGSTNFDLERCPTRTEAVVLLIRLLGKDAEALAYPAEKCPFTDVPDWAKSYIAYAYDTGLTNGVGGGKFGTGDATLQQFETFVLRAMGYSDAGGEDFTWDHPETLAENLGIVLGPADTENFTRGTCVKIMEIALRNAMKDGTRLADKLIEQGVFTREAYEAAFGQ